MDVFDAIRARSSVRKYSDKPLPEEVIARIVDCARFAPTARGEEPWEFIAVTEREELVKIAAMTDHGKFIAGCACAIVVCCRDTKYYLEDGCAATENILVAAAALGVGSCWVAGDKKPYARELLASLGVPEGYKLVSVLALGYPAEEPGPKKKRPLREVLHRDRF